MNSFLFVRIVVFISLLTLILPIPLLADNVNESDDDIHLRFAKYIKWNEYEWSTGFATGIVRAVDLKNKTITIENWAFGIKKYLVNSDTKFSNNFTLKNIVVGDGISISFIGFETPDKKAKSSFAYKVITYLPDESMRIPAWLNKFAKSEKDLEVMLKHSRSFTKYYTDKIKDLRIIVLKGVVHSAKQQFLPSQILITVNPSDPLLRPIGIEFDKGETQLFGIARLEDIKPGDYIETMFVLYSDGDMIFYKGDSITLLK